MTPFVQQTAGLTRISTGPALEHATGLRVSPDGRRFIVGIDEDDEGEPSGHFVAGAVGEAGTSIAAADAQFLDDRRLLTLTTTETEATIALRLLSNLNEPVWRRSVDAPMASRLLVDPRSGRWRVSGYTRAQLTRIDGDAGGDLHVDTWRLSASDARQWIVGDGPNLLGLKSKPQRSWNRRYLLLLAWELDIPKYPRSIALMVVWRFHDFWHRRTPDGILTGMVKALGWESYQKPDAPEVFAMPETTLETLAASIRQKLDARTLRVVGDPAMKVSKVGLAPGFGGFDTNRRLLQREDVQVEVIGEAHEWEIVEYAADATTAKAGKALIVIGHIPSEQAGMDECARWLKAFVTEVPVEFVPAKQAFWMPK